jgi:hypothetical protein
MSLMYKRIGITGPFSGTTNHESPLLRSTLRGFPSEKGTACHAPWLWRCGYTQVSPPLTIVHTNPASISVAVDSRHVLGYGDH